MNHTEDKNIQNCIKNCKSAIQRDPTYAKAFFRYAQALALVGKKSEALEKCKEAKKVVATEQNSKPPKDVLKQLSALKSQVEKLENKIKDTIEEEMVQANGWKAPITQPAPAESTENDLDINFASTTQNEPAAPRDKKSKPLRKRKHIK